MFNSNIIIESKNNCKTKNEIYIDISQTYNYKKLTGIQRVVKEFITIALEKNDFNLTILIYKESKYYKIPNELAIYYFQNIETNKILNTNLKEFIFENTKINSNNKIFLDLDSPWNSKYDRSELYPLLKKYNFFIVSAVYDLIPIKYPNYIKIETVNNFPKYIENLKKYSNHIIFNSNSAKEDFLSYIYPHTVKHSVFKLGSNIEKKIEKVKIDYYDLENKKFILFVGTLEPRKRHNLILKVFEEIYKEYSNLDLVFIGKEGWNNSKFILNLRNNELLNKRLFWFENLNDKELNLFYKNAYLCVYLSEYEGYGLPIVESLNNGNVIITSSLGSMKEVGFNFADYLGNNEEKELKELLKIYLDDENIVNIKKKNIKLNYKSITWNNFYEEMKNMLTNELQIY